MSHILHNTCWNNVEMKQNGEFHVITVIGNAAFLDLLIDGILRWALSSCESGKEQFFLKES